MTTVLPPAKINFTIYKGGLFRYRFKFQKADGSPENLTGYSARMHIRSDFDTPNPPALELLTSNGRLIIEPVVGWVDINLSAADTTSLLIEEGVYDLELVNGDTVIKLAWGKVKIMPEVTR